MGLSIFEAILHKKASLLTVLISFNVFTCFRFSQQELKDGKSHVTKLTDKWSRDIQSSPLVSDISDIELDLDQD